jgi:hypothetical protein
MLTRIEKVKVWVLLTLTTIGWAALILFWMSSCKILTGYPHRALMTMETVGETIAVDDKHGVVYVIFRCIDPPSKVECGMVIQFDLKEYGDTYLGELRYISDEQL